MGSIIKLRLGSAFIGMQRLYNVYFEVESLIFHRKFPKGVPDHVLCDMNTWNKDICEY